MALRKGDSSRMTLEEWRNDKLGEHEIPLWKFLRITHYYTERVGIYVVSGDNWQPGDHDFWLSRDVFKGIRTGKRLEELERMLKYYADVPVWNVCAEWEYEMFQPTVSGRLAVTCLTARCNYDNIREGLAREKADRRREQNRESARRRRMKKDE